MTTEPGIDNASVPEQAIVIDHIVPPMAFDPSSESADEDEASLEDEWVYPNVPEPLRYERYLKTALNVADRVGTVKLMAQHGFMLKPMIEEAVVPSKNTMSTYSSYLRKVTSYVASWTGCVTMKVLRSYRKKSDDEWIRLYNYCLQKTNLSQTHMYLGAKELAALCGVLEADEQVVRDALRPITNRRFLNQAATSSTDCSRTAGTIRITKTGLFTDFDIQRKSLARNLTNIQGALTDQFAWGALHHVAIGEPLVDDDGAITFRCIQAVLKAKEFAAELQRLEELGVAAKSGTSIHIWLSFGEFVTWSKDGMSSSFTLGEIELDLVKACSDLVQEAGVPVFVNLCSCSKFFNAEEMNMEKSVGQKLASSLAKSGVPTTSNQLFWSECSNFIDGNFRTTRPTSSNPEPVENKDWDVNAAFACVDKFLFREKTVCVCGKRFHD